MNDSSFGGGWMFVLVILVVLFGMGGGLFGGGNATMAGYATTADINAAIAQQTSALNQQSLLLSSANNNFETARLIDAQTMAITNQNNANLINAIQGYNSLGISLQNGFATLNQSISDLGFRMENCCCGIKTMMLENRLQDTQIALQNAQNVAVNAEQSQYLLSQLGSFVPKAAG